MKLEIQRAVQDAVSLVNSHAGAARVRLWFEDDPAAIDFVANSASLRDNCFEFRAGFETYGGNVAELRDILIEVIDR